MDEHMRKVDQNNTNKNLASNLRQQSSSELTQQDQLESTGIDTHDAQHTQQNNVEDDVDFGQENEGNLDQIDYARGQQVVGTINESSDGANPIRKLSQNRQPPWKFQDNLERGLQSYSASYYDVLHEDDYLLQDKMSDPISFLANTMYHHQAMKEPDSVEFKREVIKEILDHCSRKHWVVVKRDEVPKQCDILPAVWSMKRKRDLVTRIPYKYRA